MNDLIKFIKRFNVLLLYLLLSLFCFYFIIVQNSFQKKIIINSYNNYLADLYANVAEIKSYFNLKQENERLMQQNEKLLKESDLVLKKMKITEELLLKDGTLYRKNFGVQSAKVIHAEIHQQRNFITLDKGTLNDVTVGMGVISTEGVVGIVQDVSPNFSLVLPIINTYFRLSAKIKHNQYFGSVIWKGQDVALADLEDIPNHVPINIGDSIITTSFSSAFPEGVLIGTIYQIEKNKNNSFYQIKVRLSNNFSNISAVYLLNDLMKTEKQLLEKNYYNTNFQ